jgi:hypothetical protein
VVAAAAFLGGRRDAVPEAVTLLRANDAPADLVDTFRAVARDRHLVPATPTGLNPDPAAVAAWALGALERHSHSVDALANLPLAGVGPVAGALLGALAGARDGTSSWPAEWFDAGGEDVPRRRTIAQRLGG